MELALVPDADEAVVTAVRAAVSTSGADVAGRRLVSAGAWWTAGLVAAVERAAVLDGVTPLYDASRSPRSTRGATRA